MGGTGAFRFRKGLVVAQVALSLLLLIGAGLFTRSLMNLRSLDPGFEPERLLAFSVDPSLNGYDLDAPLRPLRARSRRSSGPSPACASSPWPRNALMTDSNSSSTVVVEGYEAKEGEDMNPNFNGVGPEFFATLGIPPRRRPRVHGRPTSSARRRSRSSTRPSRATSSRTRTRSGAASASAALEGGRRKRHTRSRSSAWPATARPPRSARSRSASSTALRAGDGRRAA